MSGPYIDGLGKRRWSSTTTSSFEIEMDDTISEILLSCEEPERLTSKRRRVSSVDSEVIPMFQPEDCSSNIIRVAARAWYDDLDDYNFTRPEWKQAGQAASTDYVDLLEKMLRRTKQDTETMTTYYHDKLSLLKKCNIDGDRAKSCIIRGLPLELRANAKAYFCEGPEQLYFGYLSSLENYRRVETTYNARKSKRRGISGTTNMHAARQQLEPRTCYFCRRPHHEARDYKPQQTCETCQRVSHTTATCWFSTSSRPREQTQDVIFNARGSGWEGQQNTRGSRVLQDGGVLNSTGNTL